MQCTLHVLVGGVESQSAVAVSGGGMAPMDPEVSILPAAQEHDV